MSDLIERNALLDALPKNDVVLSFDVRRIVADLPAVGAVSVVCCKDCIHSEPVASLPKDTLFCNTNDLPFPADGFCSRGMRKEIDNG